MGERRIPEYGSSPVQHRYPFVRGFTCFSVSQDDAWVKGEFLKTVQVRGAAVIKARKLSSAMSAAKAICDHVRYAPIYGYF